MKAYGADFFNLIEAGAKRSADAVVPLLMDIFAPSTVVDVGCGQGAWGATFADAGCAVTGIDGHAEVCAIEDYRVCDLETQTLPTSDRYDLAVCLEVAEHVTAAAGDRLVAELVRVSDVVVFSAAIPGQGGHHHINEQPPAYWQERFACWGYEMSGALRFTFWDDDDVENWYRQNLTVCTNHPHDYPALFDGLGAHPFHLVHPVLFDHHR